jgi:hypothetical protein
MSRVPWHAFSDRQPRAHLVAASVQADQTADDDLRATQVLLQRLVRKLKPASDYSTTIVRDAGHPEVYFAFDDEADARKFAATVEAGPTGSYLGSASQRAFDLVGAKFRALESSLPSPWRDRRRDPPDKSSLPIRVRRGPRTPVRRYEE